MRPRLKSTSLRLLAATIALVAVYAPAHAGAWLQQKGRGLLILSANLLSSGRAFDDGGNSFDIPRYNKFELDGWLKKLGPEAKDMKAYFISIDPERDTPEVMNRYVGNFSDRITGISGPPDKVWAMAKAFNIYFHKVPTDDGDYTMDHTASVILLDRKGDYAGTIAYDENEKAALAKLKRLEAGA